MAAILADDNLKCIFLNETDRILIQVSLIFFPMSSRNCLLPDRWQAITRTNADPVDWHIHVTLGGVELTDKNYDH